ncbi:MAG: transposase, partial [Ignavibacteria bacterium]|nr:transposase [Ignavibacteria bacterium]
SYQPKVYVFNGETVGEVAGGATQQGNWKPLAKAAMVKYATYLYPVKALSKEYSKIFMQLLKASQEIEPEHQPEKELIRKLNAHKWVVYAKQPFFGPKQVIEYLGRYTHKVAISNHRIKSVEDGLVTFSWKDYRHGDVQKLMTLEAPEFLRRFCLHVLPFRFVKIRHYGILSSRNKLKLRDVQFGMGIVVEKKPKPTWQQVCRQKLNFDPELCPHCKAGHFHTVSSWRARAPPPADAVHRAAINATASRMSL